MCSQVEADRLAHEHVERHLIDGRAAALGVQNASTWVPTWSIMPRICRASAERVLGRAVAPGLHLVMRESAEG